MKDSFIPSYTAFAGERRVASGPLGEVALQVKEVLDRGERISVLIFDDRTSEVKEVDFRGTAKQVVERIDSASQLASAESAEDEDKARGPGRPKLGVVGKEVTLLPRHWDWLNEQPGGPSVTIRRLVEEARRANHGKDFVRKAKNATYKFMTAMAGNYPGYEEATRILFATEPDRLAPFEETMRHWPADIRRHTRKLMKETLKAEASLAQEALTK